MEPERSFYFLGEGSLTLGEDTVDFTPAAFTLLAARQDRFAPLALAGGIITLCGLAMAFLLQPKALWAIRKADGKWILRGRCRKGQALMKEQLAEAAEKGEHNAER